MLGLFQGEKQQGEQVADNYMPQHLDHIDKNWVLDGGTDDIDDEDEDE